MPELLLKYAEEAGEALFASNRCVDRTEAANLRAKAYRIIDALEGKFGGSIEHSYRFQRGAPVVTSTH